MRGQLKQSVDQIWLDWVLKRTNFVRNKAPNHKGNLQKLPEVCKQINNDELKKKLKSKEISEDDEKKFEKTIQTYTDNFVKKVDEKVSIKEKEIMTI